MKLMLAYSATNDVRVMRRLNRAIDNQTRLCTLNGQTTLLPYYKCLFINDINGLLPATRAYFDEIIIVDPFVYEEGNRVFCMPKYRNASLDKAFDIEAEWMMLCDSDTVIVPGQFEEPSSQYGIPRVYWQKDANESLSESIAEIDRLGDLAFSNGNSWFIIHRSTMKQIRFNEQLTGYGWEDNEYQFRSWCSGIKRSDTKNIIVHVFHDAVERNIVPKISARNRAIAIGTQMLCDKKLLSPFYIVRLRVYFAIHHTWQSCIVISPTGLAVHIEHATVAFVEQVSDNQLVLHWQDYKPERYNITGTDTLEIDRTYAIIDHDRDKRLLLSKAVA